MRQVDADEVLMRRHLDDALDDVLRDGVERTAAVSTTRRQRWWLVGIGAVLLAVVLIWTTTGLAVLATAVTLLYLATLVQRWSMVTRSLRADPSVHVPDDVARAVPDADLPVYSVLVPAFREPAVIDGLVAAIDRLEYPRHLLDVLVLLEEGDDATIARARAAEVGDHMRLVVVPAGEPRTKPRALDVGLRLARGELVTIYDAEDHPEPLQLRRAAVAFRGADPALGCLQARLGFYSGGHNLLTRWFTVEYATWFALFLPGLVGGGSPVPLGGTSNHFRMAALRQVGGWDPWNVTEDCDLGIRLHRARWTVGLLDSVTMEEPNSDVINWVKQRSRWYKGYLQTVLVHVRRPRELWEDLGARSLGGFLLFVGCTPLLGVLNLFFWFLAIVWMVTRSTLIASMYPGAAQYLALAAWLVGNLSVVYLSVLTVRTMRRPELLPSVLAVPVYWVLMSIAAVRAITQLVTDPHHWEKTEHGLADPRATTLRGVTPPG